ncbi:M48 family metalloprotease [Nostoc sp. FACHB-152]|uniref:M48 family metalloprotease n=1 Tax=unclassified Nostoc TaxID=2593658 RepID=UPI00168539CA|nr:MULTISPECIES: M48 family metalloprotease [unclassified Nostoc]MBD2446840.1 M48 family metalloprotease [Nostoc sp. FACHB-152]MBD2467823.1 M48 family metalloprotease [Nostoc sp. FACHB-145]
MPSRAESSLEAGLTALKQGNYQTAIAQLESVTSSQVNGTTSLQARVGLVMAYARIGEIRKAIALCETLKESQNSQVQDWAERALEHLAKAKKRKKVTKKAETGFVAFDNSEAQNRQSSTVSPRERAKETTSPHYRASIPPESLENNYIETSIVPQGGYNLATRPGAYVESEGYAPPQPQIYWRQAKRAKVWQPLRKPSLHPLRLLGLGTIVALFWVLRATLEFAMASVNLILDKLPYLEPLQLLYRDPKFVVLGILLSAIALSPWLLDWLLARYYGQEPLSKDSLHNYSRETGRVLHRYCQQKRWQLPQLRILPISAPIALTYGNLPRNARIVVSEGLLHQLADDEIATIYATQLGHIAFGDYLVMSLVLLITLPIHRLYQQISDWGNGIPPGFLRWPFNILASLSYGIWCLFTGPALWFSRLRLNYSDRLAAEITGNPNALIRALLKIAIGIAFDVQKAQKTNSELESLNLLMPVGYKQSLSLGSVVGHIPFECALMWDHLNPYARWFTINNSHPLIGDRAQILCQIARHWHVETELHLARQQSIKTTRQSFLRQIAPFVGVPLGFILAALIWLSWQTAFSLKFLNLKWIYEDWNFVSGCLLIGFSIGLVIRMNAFFPDIKTANGQADDSLSNLMANPSSLPIDSPSVKLVGKLLGRPGTANSLSQDLILQSSTGLVKLHHVPWLCLGQKVNPQDLIGRQITVTGWFRRGATPWIDIHTLQTQGGKTVYSHHPIWSTILAIAAQAWGAYIFLIG